MAKDILHRAIGFGAGLVAGGACVFVLMFQSALALRLFGYDDPIIFGMAGYATLGAAAAGALLGAWWAPRVFRGRRPDRARFGRDV